MLFHLLIVGHKVMRIRYNDAPAITKRSSIIQEDKYRDKNIKKSKIKMPYSLLVVAIQLNYVVTMRLNAFQKQVPTSKLHKQYTLYSVVCPRVGKY